VRIPYASLGSAAGAGVWSGVGLSYFEAPVQAAAQSFGLSQNASTIVVALCFFFVPVGVFVIGRPTGRIGVTWFLDTEQRKLQWEAAKRGLAWFGTAAAATAFASLLRLMLGAMT
jgi:hypothetical protein